MFRGISLICIYKTISWENFGFKEFSKSSLNTYRNYSFWKSLPSPYLPSQSSQNKHKNKVWNMFKISNKYTRTTPMASF